MSFYVCLLRCSDGSLYIGHTGDLERRVAEHQFDAIRGYTTHRRLVSLAWCEEFFTRQEAFKAEQRLKGWSRARKEPLIRGNWDSVVRLARAHGSTGSP